MSISFKNRVTYTSQIFPEGPFLATSNIRLGRLSAATTYSDLPVPQPNTAQVLHDGLLYCSRRGGLPARAL